MPDTVQLTTRPSTWQRVGYFLRLGRPLHLIIGFIFNGLGISQALYLGATINWVTAVWCQVAITATQLMTHYSNDYFDQDADAATLSPTRWSSGSRVLPDGLLPPRTALTAASFCGGVALGATAVLMTLVSSPFGTFFLLGLSIFLAWNYSSPPLWLNQRGLGEISAALLVPGLTTLLAFQVQTGQVALLPILVVIPLCFFQFAMLLSVNFPDAAGDVRVNKRTLVVIFDPQRTASLFLIVLIMPYLLLPLLVWLGLPAAIAFAVLIMLPLAVWQGWCIRQGAATDPTRWEALAFWSIGLLLATALLETAVFLILPI